MPERSEQTIPFDLLLVSTLGAFMIAVAVGQFDGLPGQFLIGFLAVLFAPGYAFISVLFPSEGSNSSSFSGALAAATTKSEKITVIERIVLSVGVSVCLVPFIALVLQFVYAAVWSSAVLGITGSLTVLLSVLAGIRRANVEPWDRYSPGLRSVTESFSSQRRTSGTQSWVLVLLVVGFLIVGAGLGVAVLQADRGEQFTEFAVMTEDAETGELIAGGYPEEIPQGESDTVYMTIENQEQQPMEYTVVVLLQSFDQDGQLQEQTRLDTMEIAVDADERIHEPHRIEPEMAGTDLRVTYLLYFESPPETESPATDNADRQVHLWMDVPG